LRNMLETSGLSTRSSVLFKCNTCPETCQVSPQKKFLVPEAVSLRHLRLTTLQI